jgi:Glycosyltransferase like family 2
VRGDRLRGLLLLLTACGHVLYPVTVLAVGRARGARAPEPPAVGELPPLSVVVPAYRESRVIADKVRNLRENGYPGPVEVVVVPEDEDTEAASRETDAVVVPFVHRTGKAGALNRGIAASTHAHVVLTDANARLSPGALARLVSWLGDPDCRAAGARKQVDGEGAYWRYEDWVKRTEMLLGSTIALDGAAVALRRGDFRPLPEDVVVDDLWLALDAVEAGGSVVYDAGVLCEEEGFPSLADDWERRTRIVAGMLDALWRRRELLRPTSLSAFQLWGHRAIRNSIGPVSNVALVASSAAAARRSRTARLVLAGHAVLATAAASGRLRRNPSRPERLAYSVVFMQAVGVGGTLRFLRGDRPVRWAKQERAGLGSTVDA